MIAAIILTALQLADAYTTHRVLSNGGRELHPVLARLFAIIGHIPGLLLTKAAYIAAIWWALPYLQATGYEWVLWVLAVGYTGLIAFNLRSLR